MPATCKKPAAGKRVLKHSMKRAMKKRVKGYSHFSEAENNLLGKMKRKGKTPQEVADVLDRDLSAVARHFKRLDRGVDVASVGRQPALTEVQQDKLVSTAESMIEAANSNYQVTADMVTKACKISSSDQVALKALHNRGVYFHPFREKPVRTAEDEKCRRKFAKEHKDLPASHWESKDVQGPYLTGKAWAYARKHTARGAFRGRGKGLAKG